MNVTLDLFTKTMEVLVSLHGAKTLSVETLEVFQKKLAEIEAIYKAEQMCLTIKRLKAMSPDTIFATGVTVDNFDGLYVRNTNKKLKWVAVRGNNPNWCIYYHFPEHDAEWIRRHGDKVCDEQNIKKIIPCDDEAFRAYRF